MGYAENYHWSGEVPVLVRGMVLAGENLFIAGPRDVLEEGGNAEDKEEQILRQEAALLGEAGAVLRVISAENGENLHEYELNSPPVFDGMAAANGRLYLATMDDYVSCWSNP